ncbi:MAG: PorV/PorQ family protein [Calditrichia bacterium]
MIKPLLKMTLIFAVLGMLTSSLAQTQNYRENVSKRGTTAATFLEVGIGSRALAMGNAFTALSDDPSAIYWNPGGLAKFGRHGLTFNHTEWIADTRFDFVAGAFNLGGYGTLGFSLTALTMDEMQVTTVDEPEGTGQLFNAGDYAFSIAYAFNLTDRFSIGFNPKVIRQNIWEMSATGFAIDIGVHYVTPFPGFTMGFAMTNFGTKMQLDGHSNRVLYDLVPGSAGNNDRVPAKLETDRWSLPLNFRIGVLYEVLDAGPHHVNIEADAAHPNNNYESVNVGMEYVFNDRFALRGGYKSLFLEDSEDSFTLGAGLNYPVLGNIMLHFDFAYADFGLLENVQKYTIGIDF